MNTHNASWMDAVLDALRSPGAMMVALALALFPQGEHTAQVFLYYSHDASGNAQFFAYAFAAAVEVAVLLFVLAGHKRISYLFAIASFATNMVYYSIGSAAIAGVALLPVLLLSALLPACIMGYSHTIAEKPKGGTEQPKQQVAATTRRWWQFRGKPTEAPATNIEPPKPAKTRGDVPAVTTGHPNATPSESGGHSEGAAQTGTPEQAQDVPTISKTKRVQQLQAEGYTSTEIVSMTGFAYSTVQSAMRRAVAQTNGVHQ